MFRRRNKRGIFSGFIWGRKSGEPGAYEEQLPAGFFEKVGRRAAANAINENRAMNLPVTLVKDGWVTREMPDGTQQRISKIPVKSADELRARNLIKGAVIHVGKIR